MCSLRCIVLAGLGGVMPTACSLAATYVTNPEAPLPQLGLCIAPVFPPPVSVPMDGVNRIPEMIAFAGEVALGPTIEWLKAYW